MDLQEQMIALMDDQKCLKVDQSFNKRNQIVSQRCPMGWRIRYPHRARNQGLLEYAHEKNQVSPYANMDIGEC